MGHRLKTAFESAEGLLRRLLTEREQIDEFPIELEWCFDAPNDRYGWPVLPAARLSPVPWFLPIDRFDQAVFAESLRQALLAGFAVDRAIGLAAEVNPCPCFRRALRQMRSGVCEGLSLASSLKRSRAWVGRALPDALDVGEEFGCLPAALAVFVRRNRAFTGARYRKAIGRRPDTADFAVALAALLRDHRLNVRTVRAAVRLSGGGRRFVGCVHRVIQAMEGGTPFIAALEANPRCFDRLFSAFLERVESREEMRVILERLAVEGDSV